MRRLATTIEREEGEALSLEEGQVTIVKRDVSSLKRRLTTIVREERNIES
jgi:hypothetical protein